MAPDQVVAISPSAATAIVSATPGAPSSDFRVKLRAVALDPDAVTRSGAAAWEMTLDVDCLRDKVRIGPTFGFADRRASGAGAALAPGDPAWRTPRSGTQLDSVWRASCKPHFARPLAGLGGPRAPHPLPVSTAARAISARLPSAKIDSTPATAEPPPARLVQAHVVAPPQPVAQPPVRLAKIDPIPTTAAGRPRRPDRAKAVTREPAAPDAAAQAPTEKAPTKQDTVSRAAVQVVSSPDEAEARHRLARISARFPDAMAALNTRIAPATVRGHAVYRGMVSGFASRADAAAFCGTLKSAGQSCLLRPLG